MTVLGVWGATGRSYCLVRAHGPALGHLTARPYHAASVLYQVVRDHDERFRVKAARLRDGDVSHASAWKVGRRTRGDQSPVPPAEDNCRMRWSAWSGSRGFTLAAMVLFTVMWAAMTYPQVLHMTDGVNDVGDPLLNTWALSWVAHQLPFAPAHIFDANIFHPTAHAGVSETLLAPAVSVRPCCGSARSRTGLQPAADGRLRAVGRRHGAPGAGFHGTPGVALVAGAIFAFFPFCFDDYSPFQLQHTEWMPLALWAFHRFLRDHRRRYAVVLGLAVGGQALTSMYNALFLGAYLAVVGGVVLLADWRQLPQRLGGLLAAMVLAGALASPVAIAHMRAHDVVGGRSRAEVTSGSAVWTDFLAASPSSKLYGSLSPWLGGPERHLFLGVLGVALTTVALWPPWSPVRLAYGAGLLLSVDMARGLNGWTYGLLYEHFFVFQGLRIPSRMTIMIGLSLAVLAGYGVARVLAGVRSRGARAAVTATLIAVVTRSRAGRLPSPSP